jgi:NADH-quinone oxidoreductase subunit H
VKVVDILAPLGDAALALSILLGGAAAVAALEELSRASWGQRRPRPSAPFRRAAWLLVQDTIPTERPDMTFWVLAPALYLGLAGLALTVLPLDAGFALADVRTGIVVFGAAEALALVALHLAGWAPNAHFPLIGGKRFVGLGFSYELVSMFVLIAAALPAESMRVSTIVAAQSELWNVLRQPLSLPLWIVVTWGVTYWGPMNLAGGADLGGGIDAESSGRQRLAWGVARRSMLFVFAAMGAAAFLGGPAGPVLPGWTWMLVKTLLLAGLTVHLGHGLGRVASARALRALWLGLLPLSFAALLIAGVEALA